MVDDDTDEHEEDEPKQTAEFSIRLFGFLALVAAASVVASYVVTQDAQWTALELDERAFFGIGIAGPAVLLASSIPLSTRSLQLVGAVLVVAMFPVWLILDRWEISIAVTVIVIVWLVATPIIGMGMYVTRSKG